MKKLKSTEEVDDCLFRVGVDSQNRFQVYLDNKRYMNDELQAYALVNAYDSSDDTYQWRNDIKVEFLKFEGKNKAVMNSSDKDFLKSLPEKITIYRGMTIQEKEGGDYGVAWTLDRKIAEYFAYVYRRNYATQHLEKTVKSLTIDKRQVLGYCNDREEQTIFYVHKPKEYRVKRQKANLMNILRNNTKFDVLRKKPLTGKNNNWPHKDQLYVKSIKSGLNPKTLEMSILVDLQFDIRKKVSFKYESEDLESVYYRELAKIQKNYHPAKINKLLKTLLGLPDNDRTLRKYIIDESLELGPHSTTSEYIHVIFKKKLYVPLH